MRNRLHIKSSKCISFLHGENARLWFISTIKSSGLRNIYRIQASIGFKVFLVVLIFLISASVSAQESQVIYSGLQNASSIYATTNHLFVVESGKNRILKLDHNGKLIETLGGLGTGDYQFDTPIDIDATNGLKIYISDYRNGRIQVFDRRFQFLTTITGQTAFGDRLRIKPTQLVVNNFGELFYYDEASKSISKHDENGNFVGSFELPSGFEVGNIKLYNDQLELIDRKNGKAQLMSQNGVLGQGFPFAPDFPEILQTSITDRIIFYLFKTRIEKQLKDD